MLVHFSIEEVNVNIEGLGELIPKTIEPSKRKSLDGGNFGATLTDFIKDVNQSQVDSKNVMQDFVSGNGVELHEVMVAGEKAKTNIDLLMEIRNKAVDMFKELTRIPI
jgi:flagellar hook-basal body complex protein FliE